VETSSDYAGDLAESREEYADQEGVGSGEAAQCGYGDGMVVFFRGASTMNGIGGWLAGVSGQPADRVLALFGEALVGDSAVPARGWHAGFAGLVVSDLPHAAVLFTSGVHSIALLGHARWVNGSQVDTIPDTVCRRFLEAYRVRKAAALESLLGDFALVVIDTAAQEALLAIDRFGIQTLIFGSNCDVVRRHPNASSEIDPQAIYNYAYFHVVPGPKTIYRRQERLLPGHCMTWSNGRATVQPYWTMNFSEQPGSVADFKPRFRDALKGAVSAAAGDSNCGAFLSGGTDSSTVAGTLGGVTGKPAQTYSIGFAVEGYDEMEYARIASRHFGSEQHEYYVTPEDVVSALPLIAGAYDQPFGNSSAVAAYYCARLAKSDGITRLLAGDGGDEIFGGNSRYATQYQLAYYEKVPQFVKAILEPLVRSASGAIDFFLLRKAQSYIEQASRPMPARYETYNLLNRLGPHNLFTPSFLSQVDLGVPSELLHDTYKYYTGASLINQMLGIDLKFTLADNDLPKVTRMCELAGVEVAFPLLDESLVDFSGILPARMKLRGSRLRYFFKEALRDFLPGEILSKQKHGFGMPVGAWLTTHPGLRSLAEDSLSSLKKRNIIAPAFIDQLLNEHLRTHAAYYGTMAWVLMMLELWFQKHHPDASV
jgi:asparagine synthase (glutamine-hydrolysing)